MTPILRGARAPTGSAGSKTLGAAPLTPEVGPTVRSPCHAVEGLLVMSRAAFFPRASFGPAVLDKLGQTGARGASTMR
jgi:hypothetical protein